MDTRHAADPPGGQLVNAAAEPRGLIAMRAALWAGCVLYALLFVYHGVRVAAYPYDLDNSEGFLLYQSMRLAHGEFLYPTLGGDPPWLVDNYPPLYPLAGALGVKLFGPSLQWLRFISLASTIGAAALLGVWAYLKTRVRSAGWMAALVYLSFYHVYNWGALARVDALGGLFAIAALVWFEWRGGWKMAALFCLLALFTKQSLIAAPAAIALSLFFQNRRKAASFIASLMVSGAMLLGLMLLASSGRAWIHLVSYNVNAFYWLDVWLNFRHWFMFYTVWGAAPLALLIVFGRADVSFWFTLFAIGEALLCGKIGSAPNYFLSLAASASLGTGLLYGWLARGGDSNRTGMVLFVVAGLLQLAATIHWPHTPLDFAATPGRSDAQAGRLAVEYLKQVEGPVYAELAGLGVAAGHPPVMMSFICTQLAHEGIWNPEPMLERIRERRFAAIALQFNLASPEWDRRRFLESAIAAMRENYSLARQVGPWFIYRPRAAESAQG
ncbi:MAG: hypothetical protein GC154_02990 [bacterium]|nr:hypothetical protein [bacterium]